MSELYATLLMVGVTLSLGSVLVAAASSQFSLASNSASLGANLQQNSAEVQLSIVYSATAPSSSCPLYRGYQEGSTLAIGLYDYGSAGFTPAGFVVNATLIAGSFGPLAPGSLGQYSIPLGACAHPSGLTVVAFDASGNEYQVET